MTGNVHGRHRSGEYEQQGHPLNYQRGYIEVDLTAVRQNVLNMKNNMEPGTDIMAVIKADGYGHGAVPIGRELADIDCIRGFAVATAEEAFILRNSGIRKPLLVMGYTFPYAYRQLIEEQIEIAVFREDSIGQLDQCAAVLGMSAGVHIKVDTGMTRLGILPDESGLSYVQKVLESPNIELKGIFTHFARADEADKTDVRQCFRQFTEFVDKVESRLHYRIPVKHCANSAGIIDMKEANMDAVRAGIALYGIWPSDEVERDAVPLLPVLSFRSKAVLVRDVEAGVPVSYGGTFVTKQKTRIATVPVGYGDGYPRGLSNKGYVLVKGQKAPILGRICMDQFMIDVTGIPDVREGETVTLIGADKDSRITVEELSRLSGRFHYELVCDLGKRIPRIYTKGGVLISIKDYYRDFQ